jgi:23S rRNA (guanosine2251-2'-O)-methyltransferase
MEHKKLSMDQLNRMDAQTYMAIEKFSYMIVLDNVRSMNNIGSVFRTADAFRAAGIVLTGISARPPHRDISKTALGAEETVAWLYFENNEDAIKHLLAQGYIIMCIEQVENSKSLADFVPKNNQKYAFVLGNEVMGVADEWIVAATSCLEIPQYGTKHSLNVAVTAGIVCWQVVAHEVTGG